MNRHAVEAYLFLGVLFTVGLFVTVKIMRASAATKAMLLRAVEREMAHRYGRSH